MAGKCSKPRPFAYKKKFDDNLVKLIGRNIKGNLVDKYKDTPFAGYAFLTNGKKGALGEEFTSAILSAEGHIVTKRLCAGHDRVVDGIKTEIKFSLADYDDSFKCIMNHVSVNKDWDRLIYSIINANEEDNKIIWFTKESFVTLLQTTDIFSFQQGGKSVANDDYMVSGKKRILKLIDHPLVKDIAEW